MNLKLHNPFIFRNCYLSLLLLGALPCVMAQDLYVGPNAEFYLAKDLAFTTSNTVVAVDASGTFSMEAGTNWGSAQEFVDGNVSVFGAGETTLPVGNKGVYAPVVMKHSADVSAQYSNSAPSGGTNGTDVDAVSGVEFWELTGNAVVTLPWNENSDITSLVNDNGGVLSAVSIVGLNGGVWDLISASHSFTVTGDLLNGNVASDLNNEVNLDGFGQYTFGIDNQVVLSVNDLFLSTGINLLSNPVKAEESDIRFMASGEMVDLKASIYDINGRLMKRFDKIELSVGEGNLPKSNLKSGLYFLKFEHEGKQGVKKLIIE
ncbi:T9SS type A sorting domain-containing protein [Lutimonas vermicola]|uniref:T9SS type A sorting domain-containing protein n=1 Tax=Lutimonas vermicola TaxID=414288 RepID=A0ABU9L4A3_9FLAO